VGFQLWLDTNLVRLQRAVLCANCEVISECKNGHCPVCGSQASAESAQIVGWLGRCRDALSERYRLRLRCKRHRPLSISISCLDVGADEQQESVACRVPDREKPRDSLPPFPFAPTSASRKLQKSLYCPDSPFKTSLISCGIPPYRGTDQGAVRSGSDCG
jgi:hypothetical protein